MLRSLCLLAGLLGATQFAWAGVVVGGTRVIYNSASKEASISVKNTEKASPYLIQSWVESGYAGSANKPPFIITPPLFRLDAGQENVLRIVRTGGDLPDNKESMFWLNIKSIPSSEKTDSNTLQIAVKTRIKLLYRPTALNAGADEAYKQLVFSRQGNELQVSNPTPYYIAFYNIKVGGQEIKDAGTVPPQSTKRWPLPVGAAGTVAWQTINDFGGITPAENKPL